MSTSVLRNRKTLVAAAGILLVACGAWGYMSWAKDKGPAVPKDLTVAALQAKADQDPGKVFEQVHQAMDRKDLTEEQRHAVWENAHQVMEVQMDKRMDAYFAATTPAQRNAVLDQQINEMQARMKEWQARRAQHGNDDHGPGDRGPRSAPAARTSGASAQPGTPAATARPADGQHGPRHEPSRQERKSHTESRDPDKSARRMAYFAAMRQRAEERGIQMPFGRGGDHH